ncbi:ABC transporter ATP-binding protein [Sneathiella chinensis]|uniref:Lipoprotein-releasing system ATP-binding protein LolD 2 n=1 Tax=Sneathiella chinensis TaxID=349750 RepID=A0ABQ5U7K3_9PROT|nr:ABC transporter ATP-binding protein [Sneathiella chinensis]GLQ07188.1 lipoprotein-releasing system ATP-binding protein LolD 2 [Sneathiella chinensis]
MSDAILTLDNVGRVFRQGGTDFAVLVDINLEVKAGEIVALLGQSGAGKSTLLHTAGLLEPPTTGQVLINGQDCTRTSDRKRTETRRREIGFVYQFHHLLPEFSAIENVMMPNLIGGTPKKKAYANARHLLVSMGLEHRLDHRPAKMSGGEQQRVAIARALANHPSLLLADEPTGNLDEQTAELVFQKFVGLVREKNVGALVATHNLELAKRMDRIVMVRDHRLVDA